MYILYLNLGVLLGMYEFIVNFFGAPPLGLEFLYYIFAFVFTVVGLLLVYLILNAFFKIFRRGG